MKSCKELGQGQSDSASPQMWHRAKCQLPSLVTPRNGEDTVPGRYPGCLAVAQRVPPAAVGSLWEPYEIAPSLRILQLAQGPPFRSRSCWTQTTRDQSRAPVLAAQVATIRRNWRTRAAVSLGPSHGVRMNSPICLAFFTVACGMQDCALCSVRTHLAAMHSLKET